MDEMYSSTSNVSTTDNPMLTNRVPSRDYEEENSPNHEGSLRRTRSIVRAKKWWKSLKDKDYDPNNDFWWWTPSGCFQRFFQSQFYSLIFSIHPKITVGEVDTAVNTTAIVSALVLAIPYGMLTSLQTGPWDLQSDTIFENCTKTPIGPFNPSLTPDELQNELKKYYNNHYASLGDLLLLSLYSALANLIFSVWYYLLRPSEQPLLQNRIQDVEATVITRTTRRKKSRGVINSQSRSLGGVYDEKTRNLANANFHNWWARGRFLFLAMFISAGMSSVFVLFATNLYYQGFFSSTTDFCNSQRRVTTLNVGWAIAAFLVLLSFYLLL